MIYWDIHAFRSLAPIKLICIIIVRPTGGTARGNFLKIPIALSRLYPSNEEKDNAIPMHYIGVSIRSGYRAIGAELERMVIT
jgi:hypothetical protein